MKIKGDLQISGTVSPTIPIGESSNGDLFPKPTKLIFNVSDGFYLTPNSDGNPVVNLAGATGTITGGTSLGGTEAVYGTTTAPTINFKGLTAGTGISLGSDANAITVTNTGPTLSQIGPGFYGITVKESDGSNVTKNDTLVFTAADFALSVSGGKPVVSITDSGIDHGGIGGLTDDDHTQYSLVTGTRAFTGSVTVTGQSITIDDASNTNFIAGGAGSVGKITFRDSSTGHMKFENDFGYRLQATGGEKLRITAEGNVGIGETVPTAKLHIKAGTATANTAPVKLTSGTLLTAPEAGAVEFLNDGFFGTITTGAERKQLAFTTDIGPGFYGITVGQSNAVNRFKGINTVKFFSPDFYIEQNYPNTDEVIINLRNIPNPGATATPYVPVWDGFSVPPAGGVARYSVVGKMVFVWINSFGAGTSNATNFTITLPLPSARSDVMAGSGHGMDNGSFNTLPMRIDTRGGDTVCDLYKDFNASSWTASGSKVADFTLWYQTT